MPETSLETFSSLNNLTIKRIEYYINSKGKKCPVGEKNNEKKEDIPRHADITHALRSYHKKQNPDITLEFIPTESIYIKHTENLYVIDIDESDVTSMSDFERTGGKIFDGFSWTKGNTKGIHIYLKIEGMPNYTDQQDIFNGFKGDLLRKNNAWEKVGKMVYGNPVIQTIHFKDIEKLFKEGRFDVPRQQEDHPEKKEMMDFVKKAIQLNLFQKMKGNQNWDICGKTLASICGSDGRQLFLDLSKSHSPDVFNEEAVSTIYDTHLLKASRQRKQITKGLLISACMKTDKKLTNMILKGQDDVCEEKEEEINWDLFSKDEQEYISYCESNSDVSRAKIVNKQLNKRLTYYSKNLYALYNEETKMWETEDNRHLLNFITDETVPLLQQIKTKCIEQDASKKIIKNIADTIDQMEKTIGRRNILTELETITFKSKFLDNMNKEKYMLPLKNGMLYDMRDNSLRERTIQDLFDFEMPVSYEPEIKEGLDKAEEYFLSLFCGRRDTMLVFLNYIKSVMTGKQLRYIVTMLGEGRNGKSLLLIILGKIFHKFMGVLSKDIFTTRQNASNINTEVLKLTEYRFGYASELKESDELNSKRIKEITGGDPINYRGLHQADTTIKPTCNIGACSQFMPSFNTQDQATIDRLICFPFNARFDVNPDFERELESNLTGIFTYIMIQGKICSSFDAKKGEITDEMVARLGDAVSDNVKTYLEAFMERYTKTTLPTKFNTKDRNVSQNRDELYELYVSYCNDRKYKEKDYQMKMTGFTSRLKRGGYESIKSGGKTYILVREQEQAPEKAVVKAEAKLEEEEEPALVELEEEIINGVMYLISASGDVYSAETMKVIGTVSNGVIRYI
jgi:phage/plasmid-associated DNA primase